MAIFFLLQQGWLTDIEMVGGLDLAETTPGPLILVTEFVGFVTAFREDGLLLGIADVCMLNIVWLTITELQGAPC